MNNVTHHAQETTTDGLQQILNKQVANWSLLGVKLHHYHWFVTGPQFYVLHEKFEEFYNTAADYVDELAERLLAIGGKPAASMTQYLKLATIQEASDEKTAEQMVKQLVADFEQLAGEMTAGIEAAGQEGDDATADLLTGMVSDVQKHAWMLNALLGK